MAMHLPGVKRWRGTRRQTDLGAGIANARRNGPQTRENPVCHLSLNFLRFVVAKI